MFGFLLYVVVGCWLLLGFWVSQNDERRLGKKLRSERREWGEFLLLVFIVLRCFRRERILMIITMGIRIGRKSLLLL